MTSAQARWRTRAILGALLAGLTIGTAPAASATEPTQPAADTLTYTLSDGTGPLGAATGQVTVQIRPRPVARVTITANPTHPRPNAPVRYTVSLTTSSDAPLWLRSLFTWRYGTLRDPANTKVTDNTCLRLPTTLPAPTASVSCAFTALADAPAQTDFRVTAVAELRDDSASYLYSGKTTLTTTWLAQQAAEWRQETAWPAFELLGRTITPATRTTAVFAVPAACRPDTPRRLSGVLAAVDPGGVCLPHRQLLHQALTALLNEAEYGVNFPAASPEAIVTETNRALAGRISGMQLLTTRLADWNNG